MQSPQNSLRPRMCYRRTWWALLLVATLIAAIPLTVIAFKRDFTTYANVTLVSDRAGLVMDANSVVKYRGVEVGRVASIKPKHGATLQLEITPKQLRYIPANVDVQISAPRSITAALTTKGATQKPRLNRLP